MSHTTASINSIYITSSGNVHTGCSKPFGDLYLRNRTSVFNVSPDAFRIMTTNRVALAPTVLSLHSKLVTDKLLNVRQVHSLTHNKSTIVDVPSGILYKQDRLQVMAIGRATDILSVRLRTTVHRPVWACDRPCTTFSCQYIVKKTKNTKIFT